MQNTIAHARTRPSGQALDDWVSCMQHKCRQTYARDDRISCSSKLRWTRANSSIQSIKSRANILTRLQSKSYTELSCMQDSFARACTRPKGLTAARPSARATIGYLVYKELSSFSSLFNLPYSKDILYFSQARHIAHFTNLT